MSLIISLIVILFVLGLSAILFSRVFLMVIGEMKVMPDISKSNNTVAAMTAVENKTIPFLDYLFFFSFVAIFVGLIISSLYIDSHPAFMIIFIVAMVMSIILAGVFANAFVEVGEADELTSTYNQFTLTRAIITHLPLLVLVAGMIVIFVLYGKGRSAGGPI